MRGVAIRRLDLLVSPLETMFFALTSDGAPLDGLGAGGARRGGTGGPMSGGAMSTDRARSAATAASRPLGGEDPIWNACRTELQKLGAQLTSRLLVVVCIAGPFAFAAVLKVQSGTPSDALFGVWVHSSGSRSRS